MATSAKTFDAKEFASNLLLGGTSGVIAKTACAPLERVKIVLQTANASSGVKYNGFADAFKGILKNEGARALWRGNLANCMRYFPTQAMNFACKEKYQQLLVPKRTETNFLPWFAGFLAAGGAAGATSLTVSYPLEYCYTRLAADTASGSKGGQRLYNGIADCISKTVKSDGIRGLYRGYGPSVAGIIVYRAGYFGLYDFTKIYLNLKKSDYAAINFLRNFGIALVVDIFSAMAAYPLDTIRRNMMMMSGRADKLYTNSLGCFRHLISQGGAGALYRGCMTNNVRAIGSALVLAIYDELKTLFIPAKAVKKTH